MSCYSESITCHLSKNVPRQHRRMIIRGIQKAESHAGKVYPAQNIQQGRQQTMISISSGSSLRGTYFADIMEFLSANNRLLLSKSKKPRCL